MGLTFGRYLAFVLTLLSLAGAAMPILSALGFTQKFCAPCFAMAAILGAIGAAAWWVVLATQNARLGQALSWMAFPVAVLSLAGMLPLLLAAAMPGLLDVLGSPDRLLVAARGTELEIRFPRLMSEEAINLEVNGVPVPEGYFRRHPGQARWRHWRGERAGSVLLIDLEALRSELALGPVRQVGLNRVPGAPQMLDASRERLQPQRFELDPPAAEEPAAPVRAR